MLPIFADYNRHLEALRGVLSNDVMELATLPGVDDGLIVRVKHDRERRVFTLILRCGNLPIGCFDLTLVYQDAEISATDAWILARVAREIDDISYWNWVKYQEVDVTGDGKVEHRILFDPGRFVTIRCRVLRWSKTPQPDRELPGISDRFPDGPKISAKGRTWRSHLRHRERPDVILPSAVWNTAGWNKRMLAGIRLVRNV